MKKNNALRNIIKFIDRKIIFPITKLILAISERFSKSSKVIENWLSKSNTLLFISLIELTLYSKFLSLLINSSNVK